MALRTVSFIPFFAKMLGMTVDSILMLPKQYAAKGLTSVQIFIFFWVDNTFSGIPPTPSLLGYDEFCHQELG